MEDLNLRAKQVLELIKKYSKEHNINTIGSEFLIQAMYETEDSLCHFLLDEYEITLDEIKEKTNEVFILRKNNGEYNSSMLSILNQAKQLAGDIKVSEEHLFMAVLMTRNTIACSILESLGLNIDELIIDVKEIYDFNSTSTDELSYIRNITKQAKNGELQTFVEREEYLNRLDVIIHRKFKNNPLLIGNAGVGKTAIVEGYAQRLVNNKSELSILSLNLTSMLAGTRYRGDFEERFDRFVKEIASKKNVIIFIDEIHTIIGAATTEGNLDVANMLKPFLARSDIKLIGATTLEEYRKSIAKDKALSRRFQSVFINEPSLDETKDILFGIKNDYEEFHNVKISNDVMNYLVIESDRRINRKFRPDKCIDVLDELLSTASINKKENVSIDDVDNIIEAYLGGKGIKKEKTFNFSVLEKYDWLFRGHLLNENPLLKIEYKGNKVGLGLLINDLKNIFNIGEECVLSIDLQGYKDSFMISSLVGAPPGYVGYEDEGVLPRHILAYPISVIIFKNYKYGSSNIQSFVMNLLANGFFSDQKGRSIILDNVIIVVEGMEERNYIGFNQGNHDVSGIFDEVIVYDNLINSSLNDQYQKALSRMNYEVSFEFNIDNTNKKKVNDYLYKLTKNKPYGSYNVKKEDVL